MDNPRNLSWRGRSNLYSQIGLYLTSSSGEGRGEKVDQFSRWCETPSELRETGSQVWPDSVWDSADPLQSLFVQRDNPTRVFLLAAAITAQSDVGARQGPFGSSLKNVHLAQRAATRREEFARPPSEGLAMSACGRVSSAGRGSRQPRPGGRFPAGRRGCRRATPRPPPQAACRRETRVTLLPMPPMPPPALAQGEGDGSGDTGTEPSPNASTAVARRDEPVAAPRPAAEPGRPERPRSGISEDEDVIRSAEQFLTMFQRLGSHGGTLRIAAGAELELPTIVVQGQAGLPPAGCPRRSRPRLRYKPPEAAVRSPLDWSVLFDLRSGSLHVQGLDLVVSDAEPRADRMAVAGLLPGLPLDDRLHAHPGREPHRRRRVRRRVTTWTSRRQSARRRPYRCEPRCEHPAPRLLPAVRGRWNRRGALPQARPGARQRFVLYGGHAAARRRRTAAKAQRGTRGAGPDRTGTARVKGGLVHLDSTPEAPELATVGIVAENSIMSTANRDEPLFRLEGREPTDDLGEKVRWKGHKVAYDQIKTYRRDEVVQTGAKPRIYDRENWLSAFLPKDESPIPGDVKFLHETEFVAVGLEAPARRPTPFTHQPDRQRRPRLQPHPPGPANGRFLKNASGISSASRHHHNGHGVCGTRDPKSCGGGRPPGNAMRGARHPPHAGRFRPAVPTASRINQLPNCQRREPRFAWRFDRRNPRWRVRANMVRCER